MSEYKKIRIGSNDDQADDQRRNDESKTESDVPREPEPADDANGEDSVQTLRDKLIEKEKEAQDTYDRLLRVSAEFDNYKKRSSREMADFRKYANQSLLKEMLSVVDNLELAIQSAGEKNGHEFSLVEGLNMTLQEMLRIFEKFNVTPVESVGQPFDPAFHEAMMQEKTDEYPENTVIREMQKGYTIHDRLLRPAMVVVAKPTFEADENDSPTEE
jgi:molecular chaperone GrpE